MLQDSTECEDRTCWAQHTPDFIRLQQSTFSGASGVNVFLRKKKKKMETGCNHCVGLDQQQAQRLKFMNTEFLDTTAEEPADN